MNISISGSGMGLTTAAQPLKMVGAKGHEKDNKKADKQNDTAAVLSISSTGDRNKAITKRYQSMKESLQKQIDALNDRLNTASGQGNTALEEQLTESIKALREEYSALDEQFNKALFEEQQRKAAEAKQKEEEAAKERNKEQEKYKTDEEKIKKEERKSFEFLAKADIEKESIQNNKIQKAKLERTKGRLEGEMATDAARNADREQRQRANLSALRNGFSFIPYVSDKTILTEKKRIAGGSFTPDESSSVNELNKLNYGIENLQNSIGGSIARLNGSVKERTEEAKDAKDAVQDRQKADEESKAPEIAGEDSETTENEHEKAVSIDQKI